MTHRSRHHRPAAVLLLSLLIMSAITATTISISVLMTSDFAQTKTTEQFAAATVAADAGIERGLWVIRAGRAKETLVQTTSAATSASPIQIDTTRAQTNVTAAPGAPGFTNPRINIPPTLTYSVDILDTSAKWLYVTNPSSASLLVTWTAIQGSGTAGQGRDTVSVGQRKQIDLTRVYTEGSNDPVFIGAGTLGYRVKITNPTSNVTMTGIILEPQNNSGAAISLLSTISLKSVGTSGDATATKDVTTLWQQPSSNVFSYVLFTEGDIKPEP